MSYEDEMAHWHTGRGWTGHSLLISGELGSTGGGHTSNFQNRGQRKILITLAANIISSDIHGWPRACYL